MARALQCRAAVRYTVEQRGASDDLLHDVVGSGLPVFLARLRDADRHLPAHVIGELERFVACGDPAEGFAWLVCDGCHHQRLVPFSCKGRGFCPSCCGRRMAERSARWVDGVLPYRRIRQWVLTVPWPRRWLFARRHDLARGVLREAIAVLSDAYADRSGVSGGRTGSVTAIQRFGSGLNLNVHFHILAIDGVYSQGDDGALQWHRTRAPTTAEVEQLVVKIASRAEAWLAGQGFGPDESVEEEDDTQATLHAAAVAGQSAFEGRRARRTQRLGGREVELPALCAACDGYTLHAGVSIGAKERGALERLCRYVLRPPLAKGRLVALEDGRVALKLRRPWSDGTTEKVFTREQLVERLAALVPPRQANQVLYHGVLAARSAWRSAVVPSRPRSLQAVRLVRLARRSRRSRWEPWAELLRRVFGGDALLCPGCGGRMHLRAVVVGPPATGKILRDLARGAAGPP